MRSTSRSRKLARRRSRRKPRAGVASPDLSTSSCWTKCKMASVRRFLLRLNNLLHPQLAEAASSREIESHLTLIEDDCRCRGMSPDDARREAKRRLGGIQQTRELHRRARAFPWLD